MYARVPVCMCACVHACMCACARVCVHVCMHACVRVLALRACMTGAHMFLLACAVKPILGLHWLSQEQYKEMEVALHGRSGSGTDRQWKGRFAPQEGARSPGRPPLAQVGLGQMTLLKLPSMPQPGFFW